MLDALRKKNTQVSEFTFYLSLTQLQRVILRNLTPAYEFSAVTLLCAT